MDDTPLGRVVEIRSTTDKDRIKNMTSQEKKIRSDWADFKRKNKKNYKNPNEINLSTEMFQKLLNNLAKG